LVFVDETGTNIAMTRTYAWSPCGERTIGHVPFRGQRRALTVVGAIALDRVRCMMAYEGGEIGARTLDALSKAVEFSRPKIIQEDLSGWFEQCGYAQPE
jgi:hypothetical protein